MFAYFAILLPTCIQVWVELVITVLEYFNISSELFGVFTGEAQQLKLVGESALVRLAQVTDLELKHLNLLLQHRALLA